MFFVWGSGGGRAELGDTATQKCDVCENTAPFKAVVDYRYGHLWYLFSFLTSREYAKVCSHCGNGYVVNKSEMKAEFPKENIPFIRKWGWAVVVLLIALVFAWGSTVSATNSANRESYIAQPMVNDLYRADLSKIADSGFENHKKAYGAIKLVAIDDNGNLSFATSRDAYSEKKGINDRLREAGYMQVGFDLDDLVVLTPQEVKALEAKGIIYSIERN